MNLDLLSTALPRPGNIQVYRFAEPGIGSVNTYWIETPSSIIVIDGQRSLSQAKRALVEIQKRQKPIRAIFLTHAHPDHFGGLSVFAEAGPTMPIYGSGTTKESIENDRFGLVEASRRIAEDDFPKVVALPTRELTDALAVTIDGVVIVPHEFGTGESESMTVLHLPEQNLLFAATRPSDSLFA